jgi:hypothetical protein
MIPFSGLSIIIHSIIILIRKVYEKFNFRFSFNFLKNEKTSYLIIFFIAGLVMINAFFLIKASLRNSPNIRAIESSLSKEEVMAKSSSNNASSEKISGNGSDESSVSGEIPIKNDCPAVIAPKRGAESLVSIVDFLALNCIDYSFKNRALIAAHFGIDNYVGSAEQNIKLLLILKVGQSLK